MLRKITYVTILFNSFLQSSKQRAVKAQTSPTLTVISRIMNVWWETLESSATMDKKKRKWWELFAIDFGGG